DRRDGGSARSTRHARRARRAPLDAIARPLRCLLIGALRNRVALETHGETRRVHHDEHVLEPAIRLADQIADRPLLLAECHDTRRARMNAELVLDRDAADIVAFPE